MAEQSYGESLFDLGVGVPGAGEGIIDLIELLKLPEIYQSYKDTGDPFMPVRDAIRLPLNVISDAATFTGDLALDIPEAVVDWERLGLVPEGHINRKMFNFDGTQQYLKDQFPTAQGGIIDYKNLSVD